MDIAEARWVFLLTASLDKGFLEGQRILHVYFVRRTQGAKGPGTEQVNTTFNKYAQNVSVTYQIIAAASICRSSRSSCHVEKSSTMTVSSLEFEDTSSGRARRTNATTFVICGCARHAFSAPPPMVPVAPVRRTFIAGASLGGLED